MVHGKVFLVGAGPGDPELLTVKAAELLRSAEIVVYDRLVSDSILKLVPESAEKIYVGKRTGKHVVTQEGITELLVKIALSGRNVVRLKGGDPFVFGRGGEEAEALVKNNIKFEVVPGVTSAIAAPAYAGIPITHRNYASSVAIVTGHHKDDIGEKTINWIKLASAVDTIVVLMGVESFESFTKKLQDGGLNPDTPAAIIEHGTLEQQRSVISTIQSLAKDAKSQKIEPPSVIVIGQVADLGRKLSWFKL